MHNVQANWASWRFARHVTCLPCMTCPVASIKSRHILPQKINHSIEPLVGVDRRVQNRTQKTNASCEPLAVNPLQMALIVCVDCGPPSSLVICKAPKLDVFRRDNEALSYRRGTF